MLALKTLVVTAVLAASAVPALAERVLLNFEDVPNSFARVSDSYKSNGIYFSSNAWSLKSQAGLCGGTGLFFGGNTNDVGCGAVELSTSSGSGTGFSTSMTINVTDGFNGLLSLLYTAKNAGSLQAFDGLDGQGTKLAQAGLNTQPDCADPDADFACNWDTAFFDLKTSTAKSLVISGIDQRLLIDNLLFGNINASTPPATNVPEPGGVALSLAALGALAWTRKRIQR